MHQQVNLIWTKCLILGYWKSNEIKEYTLVIEYFNFVTCENIVLLMIEVNNNFC